MNSVTSNSSQSEYKPAYWRKWRDFKERFRQDALRSGSLPAEAKVIAFAIEDRVNHKTGNAYVGLRGLQNDTGIQKDEANTMLNILRDEQKIDLDRPESEGGAKLTGIAWPLVEGKRWPGPGPDDMVTCLKKKADLSGKRGKPVCTTQTQEPFIPIKNLPSAGSLASPPASALASPRVPDGITMASSEAKQQFDDLIASIKATNVVGPKRTSDG
jgi:hypothetical protein